MSPSDADALVWRAVSIVSVLLVSITCVAVHVRRKWSGLVVRVATSVTLVAAFLMSAPLVDALVMRAKLAREPVSGSQFTAIDLGPLSLWFPAGLAVVSGVGYALLLKRGARGQQT